MRAPRYRFPEEVRTATRTMASRMVRDGSFVQTPEQLDAWISQAPEVKASLERGGYNQAFTAADLLPLLQVMVVKAGGPAPIVDEPPPAASSGRRWAMILGLALGLALLLVTLVMSALQ